MGEFAHEGDEGDFGGFAFGAEALIQWAEHGIVTRGDQCGHVEGGACQGAAMGDMALAALRAAIVVVRRQPGQGGGLAAREGAQFGHGGEELPGGARANSLNAGQALDLRVEGGLGLQQRVNFRFEAGEMAGQRAQ